MPWNQMISRHFGTPDTISPLRGINFSSCRTIKISTPVGVDIFMVRPTRFERATYRVGVCHSIQLSYERIYEINGGTPVIAF